MPVERHEDCTIIHGNATYGAGVITLEYQMRLYLSTGGRVIPRRGYGMKQMLATATRVTGNKYRSSKKEMVRAIFDITNLRRGKTLDEVGDAFIVNEVVGAETAPTP